eukprot:symbB.v1.2.040897.t1/scaffold7598.1/size10368/1
MTNFSPRFQDPNVFGPPPLCLAAQDDRNLEMVQLLLLARAEVNSTTEDGLTPLHLAAESSLASVKMVKLLLESRADASMSAVDGSTALHLATQQGKLQVVEALVGCTSVFLSEDDDPLQALQRLGGTEESSRLQNS